VRVIALTPDQSEAAALVLAKAFAINPIHTAAFGEQVLAANEIFFRIALAVMKGPKFVAVEGSRILGVIHWVESPRCQFSGGEKLRMMPGMIKGLGFRPALRVSSWLSAWSTQDPAEPHSHLGPIGVEPQAQGRGIGRLLMEQYCQEVDRKGDAAYLETDRPGNIDFYQRFGFEVTRTIPVLGVPNYFMLRKAKQRC
jgi:ribosomal protein S18 acetylase RimI-like enzyme